MEGIENAGRNALTPPMVFSLPAVKRAKPYYGHTHKLVRRAVAVSVNDGYAVCARCGHPIDPDEPWDLGHDDNDRSRYAGPEHRRWTGLPLERPS